MPRQLRLTLLVGRTVATPAAPVVIEALDKVEVTHTDEGRSGFQLTFAAGRGGILGLMDYPLVMLPLLRPFNRVIVLLTFNGAPRVLLDGMITDHQLVPGNDPGGSTLTVTGEDVSVMMDLEEKSVEHPAQDETVIALKLIALYAQFGLVPVVIPPKILDVPLPIERTPVQQGTDLAYLTLLAQRNGYVFYISPGPAAFTNTAYWGPPKRLGLPQRALSMNMGPESNVESLTFRNKALQPTLVEGQIRDRSTNQTLPIRTVASTRTPLSAQPAWLVNQPSVHRTQLRVSGLTAVQAFARAQGITDASTDAVTAEGEVDGLRYGGILQTGRLVGVRGAGLAHDGFYYVKRVTHTLSQETYTQRFTLTRDGTGSLSPVVVP
ncbi:MAG TPA: hypothetical protein VGL99_01165 [Chloroflexota bacterium]